MTRRIGFNWIFAVAAVVAVACSDDSSVEPSGSASAGEGGASSEGGWTIAGSPDHGGKAGHASSGEAGAPVEGGSDSGGESGAANAAGFGGETAAFRHPPYPPTPYPAENPHSTAKALLGKILFWEEQLSGDDTVACGTCHRPNAGGSDPRSATAAAFLPGPDAVLDTADDIHGSLGVVRCDSEGLPTGLTVQVTGRKAPTYLDAMFAPRLFWDGRAECSKAGCPTFSAFEDPDSPGTFPIRAGGALENQVVGPPMSAVEMTCEGATWTALHDELKTAVPLALASDTPAELQAFIAEHHHSYPELFAAAFGDQQTSGPATEINTRRIAFAIATHERRLRSDQTPWDRWNAGDDQALTPSEARGFEVFRGKARCEGCHRVPNFSDGDFHFIGFHKPSWDLGRKAVTEFVAAGAMRTPTLRNVGLREATGMLHRGAGAGASMEELVELYDKGGLVDDAEVAAVPISPSILPLQLTQGEKNDLLAFLRNGLTDPRVKTQQPPFDRPTLSTE